MSAFTFASQGKYTAMVNIGVAPNANTQDLAALTASVGNLAALSTQAKNSLVSAINEINDSVNANTVDFGLIYQVAKL